MSSRSRSWVEDWGKAGEFAVKLCDNGLKLAAIPTVLLPSLVFLKIVEFKAKKEEDEKRQLTTDAGHTLNEQEETDRLKADFDKYAYGGNRLVEGFRQWVRNTQELVERRLAQDKAEQQAIRQKQLKSSVVEGEVMNIIESAIENRTPQIPEHVVNISYPVGEHRGLDHLGYKYWFNDLDQLMVTKPIQPGEYPQEQTSLKLYNRWVQDKKPFLSESERYRRQSEEVSKLAVKWCREVFRLSSYEPKVVQGLFDELERVAKENQVDQVANLPLTQVAATSWAYLTKKCEEALQNARSGLGSDEPCPGSATKPRGTRH